MGRGNTPWVTLVGELTSIGGNTGETGGNIHGGGGCNTLVGVNILAGDGGGDT